MVKKTKPSDEDKTLEEVRKLLGGKEERKVDKNPIIDRYTNQASVKIPVYMSSALNLKKDSSFSIVFNPKEEETMAEIKESKLIIYLNENEEKNKEE